MMIVNYIFIIFLIIKVTFVNCGTLYLDHLKDNPSAGGDFVATTTNLTNALDLNCTEFDSACHWHNLKDPSVSLKWFQSAAYLDPTFFKIATGASVLPSGNYAVAASDDPSMWNATATLMSDVITCPGGTDGFSFMYWLSPKVELTICIKSVTREFPDYDYCTELPLSMSPGPIKVIIPAFNNNGFQIFITASNFTSDDGDFQGGFAILDNIIYLPQNCSFMPPSTTAGINTSNTTNPATSQSGLTTIMGTLAAEGMPTTLLPAVGTVLAGTGTTMPTMTISGTNNDSVISTVAPSWASRPTFPSFSIPSNNNQPNNLPGSPSSSGLNGTMATSAMPSMGNGTTAMPLPTVPGISATGSATVGGSFMPSMGTTAMPMINSSAPIGTTGMPMSNSTAPVGTTAMSMTNSSSPMWTTGIPMSNSTALMSASNVTGLSPTPGKPFELNSTAMWPTFATVAVVPVATSAAPVATSAAPLMNLSMPTGATMSNGSTVASAAGSSFAPPTGNPSVNTSALPSVTGVATGPTIVAGGVTSSMNSTGMPIATTMPSLANTSGASAFNSTGASLPPVPTGMASNGSTMMASIATTLPIITTPLPNGPLPTIFMNPVITTARPTGSTMAVIGGTTVAGSITNNSTTGIPMPMSSSISGAASAGLTTMAASVVNATGMPLTTIPVIGGFELNSTGMIKLPTTSMVLITTGAPVPMNSSMPSGSMAPTSATSATIAAASGNVTSAASPSSAMNSTGMPTLPPLLGTTMMSSNSTNLMPRDTNLTMSGTSTMAPNTTTMADHTATCRALTCTFGPTCPCLSSLDGTVWKTNNIIATGNTSTPPAATENPFAFVSGPSRWSRLLLAPFELEKTVTFVFDYQLSLLNGTTMKFSVFAKRNDSIVETSLVTPDVQKGVVTWQSTSAILLPGPYEYIAFEVKNLAAGERVAIDTTKLLPIFDVEYCPSKSNNSIMTTMASMIAATTTS